MMRGARGISALVVAVVVAGLGYAAFRAYSSSQAEQCYACQRPIHAHSRTVAMVNGKARVYCCPACALSEHEQDGKPIHVTELTDFATGAKLSPDAAFLVKGSDINMCAHTHELTDADKRSADLQYDRCSPSLLAFGQRSAAEEFARAHGGKVAPFSEIAFAIGR
jgi:hypothetical protein